MFQDTSETNGAVKEEGASGEPGAKAGLQASGVPQASPQRHIQQGMAPLRHRLVPQEPLLRSSVPGDQCAAKQEAVGVIREETEASLLPPMQGGLLASLMTALTATSCRGRGRELSRAICVCFLYS